MQMDFAFRMTAIYFSLECISFGLGTRTVASSCDLFSLIFSLFICFFFACNQKIAACCVIASRTRRSCRKIKDITTASNFHHTNSNRAFASVKCSRFCSFGWSSTNWHRRTIGGHLFLLCSLFKLILFIQTSLGCYAIVELYTEHRKMNNDSYEVRTPDRWNEYKYRTNERKIGKRASRKSKSARNVQRCTATTFKWTGEVCLLIKAPISLDGEKIKWMHIRHRRRDCIPKVTQTIAWTLLMASNSQDERYRCQFSMKKNDRIVSLLVKKNTGIYLCRTIESFSLMPMSQLWRV